MLRFILTALRPDHPTFIGITICAFVFIRLLPGDPVILMAGERGVSPERHAELMAQFGFDRRSGSSICDYRRRPAARRFRQLVRHQAAGARASS